MSLPTGPSIHGVCTIDRTTNSVAPWASAVGCEPEWLLGFLEPGASAPGNPTPWSQYTNFGLGFEWMFSPTYGGPPAAGVKPVFKLAPWPEGNGYTFAQVLAKTFDGDYTAAAQFLSSSIPTSVTEIDLVLMWEADGGNYEWGKQTIASGGQTLFAQVFAHIAAIFLAIDSRFKFTLNLCVLHCQCDQKAMIPSSSVYHRVSTDLYDNDGKIYWQAGPTFYQPALNLQQAFWAKCVAGDGNSDVTNGLNGLVSFAGSVGKPWGIDETGLIPYGATGYGGGDDPNFIASEYEFVNAKGGIRIMYFNQSSSTIVPSSGVSQYPKGLAELAGLLPSMIVAPPVPPTPPSVTASVSGTTVTVHTGGQVVNIAVGP